MSAFVFLAQHQEQAQRLLKQRQQLLRRFSCATATVHSIEQRLLVHGHAISCANQTQEKLQQLNVESPLLSAMAQLYQSHLDPKMGCHWLQQQLTDEEADNTLIESVIELLPEVFYQQSFDTLIDACPNHRATLLFWADRLNASVSSECLQRSKNSTDLAEKMAAFAYATYQAQESLSQFTVDQSQPQLLNQPQLLAQLLLAALLRNDPEVTERCLQFISHQHLAANGYPLLRVLALSGEDSGVDVLQRYCSSDPEQGPWLLALHGKPAAIESLIDVLDQPAIAPAAAVAWQLLSGQSLPFINVAGGLQVVSDSSRQLPHQANLQAAKKWWYQRKADWPNNQAMWQGQPRTSALLQQALQQWRGGITADLWDLYLLHSNQIAPHSAKLRVSFWQQQFNRLSDERAQFEVVND